MIWNYRIMTDLNGADLPPTLYSFMESIVNYENPDPVKIKDLAGASRNKIFNFDYPINNEIKEYFEKLFLNHFMFRRINFDTFTSFQIHLSVKLNEIMPKYLKMLEGFNLLNFDGDVEKHIKISTNNGENNINSTSEDSTQTENKYSDTPQGQLNKVQDGTYLTDYTLNNSRGLSNNNSHSTNSNINNEDITITRADEIDEYMKYIKTANNIYSMLFDECNDLFYGII